ncbi:thrombospondin type 3 repeat-containing protein [Puniceicoccus vermicola]|uniref:Uncharacterized protein n=1 Tax=Puniceicoccus vermicola TaxID=388746 RepID=A0A7X1B479_9BACT|nr:thrombospondin type 3 repeat-containing protein [Puniceicoccus vermicola]MBC2604095.1 hypothetical protein [Puniceicoccus vermicola]
MRIPFFLFLAALCVSSLWSTPPTQPPGESLERSSGLVVYSGSNPGEIMLSWWGYDGHFYFIENSADLHEWTLLKTVELGEAEAITLGFDLAGSPFFWRLRYSDDPEWELLAADLDGDGLSSYQEYDLGSDPFNPDTSGDGVYDGIAYKLELPLIAPEPPDADPEDTTPPAITLFSPGGATFLP